MTSAPSSLRCFSAVFSAYEVLVRNRAYTSGEPDVVTHLRAVLPSGWKASLLAVDGSTAADLAAQLPRVPGDITHAVISVGGNDALLNTDALKLRVSSVAEALTVIGNRATRFERTYRGAIDAASALGRGITLCTVYNGNFSEAEAPLLRVGLTVFNDAILRVAFERRHSVIDLRLVCTEPEDYANPIEPSGRGGQKIAAAIARSLGLTDGKPTHSRVFAG